MTDGEPAYLYLLVEHQSTPNRFMALRRLKYCLAIIRPNKEQRGDEIPLVVPFCSYHGDGRPYPFSTEIGDCFKEHHRQLAKSMVFTRFIAFDIEKATSQVLHRDGLASLFQQLLTCKGQAKREASLREARLKAVIQHLPQLFGGKEYRLSAMGYVYQALTQRKGEVGEVAGLTILLMELAPDEIRSDVMTLAQQLEERGRQKALQEGRKVRKTRGKRENACGHGDV